MKDRYAPSEGVLQVQREAQLNEEIQSLRRTIRTQNLKIQNLEEIMNQRDLIREVIPISGLLNLRSLQEDQQITDSLKRIVLQHLTRLEQENSV